jgi:hypothetical protein
MRKLRITPSFIIAAFSIGLLLFMLYSVATPVAKDCIVKAKCINTIENVNGPELIWESLSRQFINSVTNY